MLGIPTFLFAPLFAAALLERARRCRDERVLLIYPLWQFGADIARKPLESLASDVATFGERVLLHVDQLIFLSYNAVFALVIARLFESRPLQWFALGVTGSARTVLMLFHPLHSEIKAIVYSLPWLLLCIANWVVVIRASWGHSNARPGYAHLFVMVMLGIDSVVCTIGFLDRVHLGLSGLAASWEALVIPYSVLYTTGALFYISLSIRERAGRTPLPRLTDPRG